MKIAIIGAGIIGVTTAYELAADGHEVHVFERRNSACEETSFANAGVVSPGYVTPWAAPGMPAKILKYLFRKHAPVRIHFPLKNSEFSWAAAWLKACNPTVYGAARSSLQSLASYSVSRLQTLTKTLDLEYDKAQGYLVLLRGEQELAQIQASLKILADAGFAHTVLDAASARKIEPALSAQTQLHAALHLPNDTVANCRQFALLLRDKAQFLGTQFHFGTAVSHILQGLQGIHVDHDKSGIDRDFDQVVICAGVASSALLRPLGIHIPLIPVYGYSVSASVREPMDAPISGVMDERYKVAISRMGQRVRVAGSAEIGGDPARINQKALQTLYKVLEDWFPAAADTKGQTASNGRGQVQVWKGARPMLPAGPPRVGASGVDKVWLNLGHGSSGWALACGSARLLADHIAGRTPDIHF
jgi:D-amino-acid dehydrogenase